MHIAMHRMGSRNYPSDKKVIQTAIKSLQHWNGGGEKASDAPFPIVQKNVTS